MEKIKEIRIEYLHLGDIHPYEKNPRKNDHAVDKVAASIREFGFKVPIIIDKKNVIVTGHTRYKAAMQLGMDVVPVIRAADLTQKQIRAFRLADNKVAEAAKWDLDLLTDELADLELDFDMTDFGFELLGEDDDGYYGDERERTADAYNMSEYDPEEATGFYQMPILKPCDFVPEDIISFNYVLTAKDHSKGVHFYIDDYQFERIWNDPHTYIQKLRSFTCVFTPDFSLYREMPIAMMIWNVYRSRMIGQMCQRMGMKVIPTVSWCQEDTFEFCFDGLPEHATLSVSTIGVKKEKEALGIWKAGMDEMISRLHPKRLLIYGGPVEYDYGNIETVYYKNHVTDRMSGQEGV